MKGVGAPQTVYNNGPIILDLDGDGKTAIETLPHPGETAGASFDWSGDGVREQSAWVGKGDAFLAIDLASDGSAGPDGKIDQGKELAFNLWGNGKNGVTTGTSDLEALRLVFDTNKDGVFDSNDARWSEFRVWRDANQNGVSDPGELMALTEAGIKSIGLVPDTKAATTFSDGSAITATSWYEKANGSRNLVADVALVSRQSTPSATASVVANKGSAQAPANVRVDGLVAAMASFGANTSAGAAELHPNAHDGIGTWKHEPLAISSRVWTAA